MIAGLLDMKAPDTDFSIRTPKPESGTAQRYWRQIDF
jgi:hypothetical protein